MKMKKSKSGGSFASGALKMGSNQAALCAAAVLSILPPGRHTPHRAC